MGAVVRQTLVVVAGVPALYKRTSTAHRSALRFAGEGGGLAKKTILNRDSQSTAKGVNLVRDASTTCANGRRHIGYSLAGKLLAERDEYIKSLA
jgi:hypothetical protein